MNEAERAQRRDRVRAAYLVDEAVPAIAAREGVSESTVLADLAALDVPRRPSLNSPEVRRRVAERVLLEVELVAAGHSIREAAGMLRDAGHPISEVSVSRDLAELKTPQGLERLALVATKQQLDRVQEFLADRAQTISLNAAAKTLGMDHPRVRRLCQQGALRHRVGRDGAYVIQRQDVTKLAKVLAETVTLKTVEREMGVPWWVLRKWEGEKRLRVRRIGREKRVRLADVQAIVEQIAREPAACPICSGPVEPGRIVHHRCAGANASRIYWRDADELDLVARRESRSDAARTAHSEGRVTLRCHVCGMEVELIRAKAETAQSEGRRVFCDVCWPLWLGALCKARAVALPSRTPRAADALRAALDIGKELMEGVRRERPPRFGRRPRPLDVDLAIEALYVWRGLSDEQIRLLLRQEIGELHQTYVTRRRQQAKIRRRSRAA